MAKVIFLLRRKPGTTREECLTYWGGETHTSIVGRVPGLDKWVQNAVTGGPGDADCDGIGEMWFATDDVMNNALNSPEMREAIEDAKNFLDMEKTSLVIVSETVVIG